MKVDLSQKNVKVLGIGLNAVIEGTLMPEGVRVENVRLLARVLEMHAAVDRWKKSQNPA